VHAVVLTGGSAYGLAAADGVMSSLAARGIGFRVGPEPHAVVPVVPAAVIFDLGRGGHFDHRPTGAFGADALAAASAEPPARGCVGAGTGAQCGGLKGGFGYAELGLGDLGSVAAAVVVNAAGSVVQPSTGRLWADAERRLAEPSKAERLALESAGRHPAPSLATTIGVVLTEATLTKAEAGKVAAVAHDGMARAIRPVHSMTDGDTVFCLASGRVPPPSGPRARTEGFNALLAATADVFAAACLDAVLSATGRGPWPAYRDLAPSVLVG